MLCPRRCHGCLGDIIHSYFQVILRLEPLPLDTHRWFSFLGIQGTCASKLSPNHMTSYWVRRHLSMCALLLLPQEVKFFFVFLFLSSYAHWCLIIALPLSLLDWKWSKHRTKRKLVFILSRKSRRKGKKKNKHPVELREGNPRREPRLPPFPGECLHYSVKV